MKMRENSLVLLVVAIARLCAGGVSQGATESETQAPLAEVSGILHKGEKSIKPFLILDGSNERCYLSGKPLAKVERGARIRAKGMLRSYLFDATGADRNRPGAPAPPPFLKGWVVYLEVKEVSLIQEPFGEGSKESKGGNAKPGGN